MLRTLCVAFVLAAALSVLAVPSRSLTYGHAKSGVTKLGQAVPATISLNPWVVAGATNSSATVTLSSAAPKGGVVLTLSCSNTNVSIPAKLSFKAGDTKASFVIDTKPVTTGQTAVIVATLGQTSVLADLSMGPLALASLGVSPTTVVGGMPVTVRVTLNGEALKGGALVQLLGGGSVVDLPKSVTVPAGKSSITFTAKTNSIPVMFVETLRAMYSGATQTASLTVNPPVLSPLSLSPASVKGGSNSTGKVSIDVPAPKGGVVVTLTSSDSSATVPQSVTIPAGKTSETFTVKTTKVKSKTTVTITGSYFGASQTATLTIN